MFDIGFWELSIIGIVALIVIGPERLPGVARTAGKWFGKANRFVSNVKDDIAKEMKSEDLQNILKQQQDLADEFKQVANQTKDTVNSIDTTLGIDDLIKINEAPKQDQSDLAKSSKKKNKKSKSDTKKIKTLPKDKSAKKSKKKNKKETSAA